MLILLFAVVTQCGVHFSIPKNWHASLEPTDDDTIACRFNIDPPRWHPQRSRWGDAPAHPLRLEIYAPSATYDEALDEMGFEKDEEGRVGVPGFRSVLSQAEPFALGRLAGVQSSPFYRGYAKDESLLEEGESRVYSTVEEHIVAKTPEGRWIGIECDHGTPDASVDCEAVVPIVARSLRFVK